MTNDNAVSRRGFWKGRSKDRTKKHKTITGVNQRGTYKGAKNIQLLLRMASHPQLVITLPVYKCSVQGPPPPEQLLLLPLVFLLPLQSDALL